ncbi:Gfo/Idh/MocA family oxidoreductase [Niabella terrae]
MDSLINQIPICIIGAGAIVADAHLPAYQIAGFRVKGITNRNREKAAALAERFSIPEVYDSLEAMVAANGNEVVYDFALPASQILPVLELLPEGATVLIQKPLGESLQEAAAIRELVLRKQIRAGVNFQMRFAPFILEAKKIINAGDLGTLTDLEVYVNVHTPWHLWDFLFSKPRMEINYHSIHYVDLVRSFLGNPQRIYARSFKHPLAAQLASVRTTMILDYGDFLRATIHTNHNHDYGYSHQQSYVKLEGTNGAVRIGFGALIDYPHGVPDRFEYVLRHGENSGQWVTRDIEGSWFPHAFIGTMQQMLLARSGQIETPENNIEDAFQTMICVEAAYQSSESGGVTIDTVKY